MHYEPMQDMGDLLPPTPPQIRGDSVHHRTMASSHDLQQQPPAPPPPPMNGYHADWITDSSSGLTPCVAGALGTSGGATAQAPSSFYKSMTTSIAITPVNNSAAGSSCVLTSRPCAVVSGSPEYRQPPNYGDVSYSISSDAGPAAINNSSVTSLNRIISPSASPVHTVGATLRSPGICSSPTAASSGVSWGANMAPPPPPSHTSAGAPLAQMATVGCGGPAAMSVGASVPGVTSLKIKVGGSTSVVTAMAPLSPRINYIPLAQSQPQPTHFQAPQQRSKEPSMHHRRVTSDGGKSGGGTNGTGGNPFPAGVGSISSSNDNPDTESDEDQSNAVGTVLTKPTVEEAEARYRYLYEEYLKVSRMRTRLLEESDCMRSEHARLCDEVFYYRRKTASAAEEREAILADYQSDIHRVLCLARELAAEAAAAHKSSHRTSQAPLANQDNNEDATATSTQQVFDTAVARISASPVPVGVAVPNAGSSTEAPMPLSPPQYAEDSPRSPPPYMCEQLRLRYGKWAAKPRSTPCYSPCMTEETGHEGPQGQQRHGSVSQHEQSLLLRDEVRDVHRNTHAAVSAYMTSLDYSFLPVPGTQSCALACAPRQRQQHFTSEYRGLHFYVDVPRFHTQTACEAPDRKNAAVDTGE
ncbi:hypothetical protein JKF63_05779 [Porcisia hertigi]|uniref:Uncharacterized protein n=1 Tax=Porcisia hertigi TaxID=2761500 RepID=A0A836IRC7_9TRYP|nr:hypothetical protein JKF63_05779 [Porcisia hertigi]